ncbi:SemiSWEET transporter [Candidatus Acetothermia bacterium]|nr:SemiSWEET transporter [Candidatus Acetothermia bacterium]MBI3644279.1 SemiSWEET transporter [Candidatus Acetothermia bacterium]
MDLIAIIGYVAAVATTSSFLPQLIKILRKRRAEDISLLMYLIFVSGITLWLIYGILVHEMPIIAANGVTLVIALAILILKLKYG